MEIRAKYGTKDCLIIAAGARPVGLDPQCIGDYAVAILGDGKIISDLLHCFRVTEEEVRLRFEGC